MTSTSPVEETLARIEACLAGRAANRGCGVVVFGPDRHALRNHVLGYEVGQAILAAVCDRVAGTVRSEELMLPLAGAEVVIVVPDLPAARDLVLLADRVVAALRMPVVLADGTTQQVTVSAGLASTFVGGTSAAHLVSEAGRSRAQAEADGGDRIVVASADDRAAASAQLQVEMDLRAAFEGRQFLLHYQPLIEVATSRVDRLEALVRWQHPVRGLLYPASFLAEIDALGLSASLDRYVLASACQEASALAAETCRPVAIGVNVGAEQLLSADLPVMIADALAASGLSADLLSFEIPEAALRSEHRRLLPALSRLHLLGVGLTLDNGTGDPAPLRLLASAGSVSSYKLDRSLLHDPSSARMANAAVMVADVAGPEVVIVALGVEDETDLDRVRSCEISLVQGFGVQRPVAIGQLGTVLAAETSA